MGAKLFPPILGSESNLMPATTPPPASPKVPMTPQKRALIVIGVVFILGMLGITWDIFNRTSLPGHKKHLPTSITP
jgi:hypothetical protein